MTVDLLHVGIDFAFLAIWAIIGQIIIGERRSRRDAAERESAPSKPAVYATERVA